METALKAGQDYPASPAGVQTALEAGSHTAVVATEMSLHPDEASYVITATTPIGTTEEEEHHTGVQRMREEAQVAGEVDPDHAPAAAMT